MGVAHLSVDVVRSVGVRSFAREAGHFNSSRYERAWLFGKLDDHFYICRWLFLNDFHALPLSPSLFAHVKPTRTYTAA